MVAFRAKANNRAAVIERWLGLQLIHLTHDSVTFFSRYQHSSCLLCHEYLSTDLYLKILKDLVWKIFTTYHISVLNIPR